MLSSEHSRLKSRLEVICDPGYCSSLKTQLKEIKAKTAKLRLVFKKLQQSHLQADAKIGRVISQGCPDVMSEIYVKVKQLEVLSERNDRLQEKIEEAERNGEEVESRLEEVKAKLEELQVQAKGNISA